MNNEYGYEDYHENLNESNFVPAVQCDVMDTAAFENLYHTIPQNQLEVLVCLYLGLRPKEIVEALQYPNITRFYNMNARLKKTYRQKKSHFLGYN